MTSTNITNFRKNVYSYVDQVIKYSEPLSITTKSGSAVLVSEEDWRSLQETLYLRSIPGLAESIQQARNAPESDFVPMEDVEW